MNSAANPIETLNATQSAWLAKRGIVASKADGCRGLSFWRADNRSSLALYDGSWDLEQVDRCENGEGVKLIATFNDIKTALKALVSHKESQCRCCDGNARIG